MLWREVSADAACGTDDSCYGIARYAVKTLVGGDAEAHAQHCSRSEMEAPDRAFQLSFMRIKSEPPRQTCCTSALQYTIRKGSKPESGIATSKVAVSVHFAPLPLRMLLLCLRRLCCCSFCEAAFASNCYCCRHITLPAVRGHTETSLHSRSSVKGSFWADNMSLEVKMSDWMPNDAHFVSRTRLEGGGLYRSP
jgi:hypothetical protein